MTPVLRAPTRAPGALAICADAAQARERHHRLHVRRRRQVHPPRRRPRAPADAEQDPRRGVLRLYEPDGEGDGGAGIKLPLSAHVLDQELLRAFGVALIRQHRMCCGCPALD